MTSLLAIVMEEQGVTQADLLRRTGLAKQTVWDAYHGAPGSLATWIKIAKALDVPVARISPVAAASIEGVIVAPDSAAG